MTNWEAPKENSVEALQHGIEFADGVEFDLRIDGEGELVIYHDEFVPGKGPLKERCIEQLATSELRSLGIATMGDLLRNRAFTDLWQSGGKTVDIEIKIPHPITKIDTDSQLGSIMERLEDELDDLDLPKRLTSSKKSTLEPGRPRALLGRPRSSRSVFMGWGQPLESIAGLGRPWSDPGHLLRHLSWSVGRHGRQRGPGDPRTLGSVLLGRCWLLSRCRTPLPPMSS